MASAASASLYWPPIRRLYEALVTQRPGTGSDAAIIGKYRACLEQGLLFFKSPNAASKAAVQRGSGPLFPEGGPKIPVQEALREPALLLSSAAVRAASLCLLSVCSHRHID